MIHPRELLAVELNKRKEEFLATGKSIQNIPSGLSGIDPRTSETGYQKLLRAGRAKLAPELRKHAELGKTIEVAARTMGLRCERAQIIARENGIVFQHQKNPLMTKR